MRFNIFISAALLLFVSGCAQVEHREAVLDNPSEGAVLLRVLNNSPYFSHWNSITVERVSSAAGEPSKQYWLAPTNDATSRSDFYAASLPPGSYRFVQFRAFSCGVICVNKEVNVGPDYTGFDVQSGRLTDLDALVQKEAPGKVVFAHGQQADLSVSREVVEQVFPGLRTLLSTPPLSWNADASAEKMHTLFELVKVYSLGVVGLQDATQGTFVYGSANGVVFSWLPGKAPVPHDIGSRVSVESVLATPSGSWLAGGELGVLRQSDDHGQTWRSMRGNLPFGVVVDLTHWNERVIATIKRGDSVSVHVAMEGNDVWKPLARYQAEPSPLLDVPGVLPKSYIVDDTLITTLPGRKVAVMSLQTGESQIRDLPGSIQMFSISQDRVMRCRCAATIAVNPYESHDFGKTWQSSTFSRFAGLPVFRDDKHGVVFERGLVALPRLAYTSDGGATWTENTETLDTLQTSHTPISFDQLFYSQDGKMAYAGSPEGAFLSSSDDGRHWQVLKKQ